MSPKEQFKELENYILKGIGIATIVIGTLAFGPKIYTDCKNYRDTHKKERRIEQLVQDYSQEDLFEVRIAIENAKKFCRNEKDPRELGAYTLASLLCENNDGLVEDARTKVKSSGLSIYNNEIAHWTAAVVAAKGDLSKVISTAEEDHYLTLRYNNDNLALANYTLANILGNNNHQKFIEMENKLYNYDRQSYSSFDEDFACNIATMIAANGDLTRVKAARKIVVQNFYDFVVSNNLKSDNKILNQKIILGLGYFEPSFTLATILAQNNNKKKD